jgi:hypothetical protein
MYLPYVYLVTNKITNEFYYGSRCKNVKLQRTPEEDFWIHYFTSSKKIKHLIELYGKESFDVTIVCRYEDYDPCYWYEQHLITENIQNPLCLNKTYSNPETGVRKFSNFGIVRSKESIDKASAANTGQKRSVETRAKMSMQTGEKNHNYGKHMSVETKAKLSVSKKNCPGRIKTDEEKAKISATMKGRPAKNKGVPHSEETKAKMSAAMKAKKQSASVNTL